MKKRKLIIVFTLLILLSGCHVGRFFIYNFANITDYKKFPDRTLLAPEKPFKFIPPERQFELKSFTIDGKNLSFENYLTDQKTVAFLIIRNDTMLFEKYYNGYSQNDIVASFSMAKSITSILIGCAIDDGLIRSDEDAITDYVKGFKDPKMSEVKIKHLLQMTSGIDFNESYVNPFGEAALFYYGRHLEKYCSRLKVKNTPGTQFNYVSGDTQLLGLLLKSVLKERSITYYLQEKIWTPLGMESDASWSLDKKDGVEKTFCCVNAIARDFAKIGRLYLNEGNWNGKQIVNKNWVAKSTSLDESENSPWYYQYQWWIPNGWGAFMAEGILGQFVYVYPPKNLIIVRLGKKEGSADWWGIFNALAAGA